MGGDKVTRVTLCCGVQGCPTVEVDREAKKVLITDDSGGKVTLTTDEWQKARTDPTLAP